MDGGDDLAASLRNYEIQLQQVHSALANPDGNDADQTELLKLKTDLEEVINLTKDLMTGGPGKSSAGGSNQHAFKAGDRVLAPWSEDGMYYEAVLEEVMADGQCNVTFCDPNLGQKTEDGTRRRRIGISEVCLVNLLKPCDGSSSNYKKPYNKSNANSSNDSKSSKHVSREDLKKKQEKRRQKVKELEEEREKEKNKWQSFNSLTKKGSTKTKKKGLASALGKGRVSIFASPDGVDGRVGIGTCGISGKPMTKYTSSTTVPTNSQGVALHHASFQKKKQLEAGFGMKK